VVYASLEDGEILQSEDGRQIQESNVKAQMQEGEEQEKHFEVQQHGDEPGVASVLFLWKLSPLVTEEALTECFGRCLGFIKADVPASHKPKSPRCIGFVSFVSYGCAERAMISLRSYELMGENLLIKMSDKTMCPSSTQKSSEAVEAGQKRCVFHSWKAF
jgi:RNA recognition motif-containing protein